MELRNLKAFAAVARLGTFQQAAKELHATQSAVSKSVRQLEEDLGVQLLERGARKSWVTDAGQVVLRRALNILSETSDLREELSELAGVERGTLRIGLPALGTSAIFGKSLSLFHKKYPRVSVEPHEHGSQKLEELLHSGEIEMAAFMPPIAPEFESVLISRQPLNLIVSANDPLAARRRVDLGMIRHYPFVLFESSFMLNAVVTDACRRQGFEPSIVTRSSQIDFIVELVSAGVGVSVLPRNLESQFRSRKLASIEIADSGMEWVLALVWRRGGYLSSAARAWRSILLAEKGIPVDRGLNRQR